MKMVEIINKGQENIMNTYNRFDLAFEKGEGMYLEDADGKKYLDFVAGIAVNCLGYGNKKLIANITEQLNKLFHCSNLYWNEVNIETAQLLLEASRLDKVFFCNSGAEAVESALKLSRKYGLMTKGEDCNEIITMKNSFHGRTFGAITATGQTKYQAGLSPLLPGVSYAEFNNIDSVKELVSDKTCAIVVEPVQGEGGIKPAEKKFLQELRNLCDEKGIVLIFDEVQCGIGRIGDILGYQVYGVQPDVVTLAKGLGGGIPIGAMIAKQKVAEAFQPGDHASTFGGNPIACTAAKTVLEELKSGLLQNVVKQGEYLATKLKKLSEKYDIIKEARGIGLMQGIELNIEVSEIINACIEKGLLLVNAGTHVIRFVPPLIVSKEEIDKAIEVLDSVLAEV